MTREFKTVCERVRERVEPDAEERQTLAAVREELVTRTESAFADLPVEVEIQHVGSTARDTWLAGERDIDLFVAFPPSLDREELEAFGLKIGHTVLPNGTEEFAEHPYVVGEVGGFAVDLVPCYAVDDATAIQSAVDRTPFHNSYVSERLDSDLAGDVRVCKQFFNGIGVYGSDLRTKGFSGFLTELLVLEYGGFRSLVDAATGWHPPVQFDPADHGTTAFDDALVVVDPTDPDRNVAAVCSAANVARVQHFARELVAKPRIALFESAAPAPLEAQAVRTAFADRETVPVAVRFDAPDVVDDQLWPQLERSREGIGDELDRRGFDVLRSVALADETAVLLFELAVAERPRIERHDGPPVHVREHARKFCDAYAGADVYGPFIEGNRYVVERERAFETAAALLGSDAIFDVALGAHVESALEDGYDLLVGEGIGELAEAFGRELARYLSPTPRG